jgi:hypothetical protein
MNCAQTNFQSKQRGFNRNKTWPLDRDVRKVNPGRQMNKEEFSVPLRNRFAGLVDDCPEN